MAQPDGVIVHGDVAISEIATKRFKITITSPYADKSASGTPSFIKKETVLRTDCGGFFHNCPVTQPRCGFVPPLLSKARGMSRVGSQPKSLFIN